MTLEYFDAYVAAGFKPIAVNIYTKKPAESNWNKKWSVERWRKYFEKDVYNIGILLGNVIDIEADCQYSNDLLDDMIGNQKHIKFTSYRSTHHLFFNEDKTLNFLKIKGIEFRGHGLHSVVPPSVHENGYQYKFCKDNFFTLTYMPETLKKLYEDFKSVKNSIVTYNTKKKIVYKNNCKTKCNKCKTDVFINRNRLRCEVKIFMGMNELWQCHKCRKIKITKLVKKMLN